MIGVDFGGTRIKIANVEDGQVVDSCSIPTDKTKEPIALLQDIADAIRELDPQPESVGFAIPGEVDPTGRCWRLPNVPGFEGVPMRSELSSILGCPVSVENDGTAAALAEFRFGHGQNYPNFLILTLGTGIGGGVVLDGIPRRGANGFAGELGHIAIHHPDSWPCVCGQTGCLETYIGTAGLKRKFEELGGKASEVRDIADSARAGEAAGLAVFEMMGEVLALGLCSLQNILDVDAFVFTGGISPAFDLIEPSCRKALHEKSFAKPLAEVPLLVSELGDSAGVVGAAYLPSQFAAEA
ncbi:MAG TPA: ROK family protein [Myxococcales bacterium]|nr:ROK family protein [Myxococcales bacterium]